MIETLSIDFVHCHKIPVLLYRRRKSVLKSEKKNAVMIRLVAWLL
jgi:hypothetical protein